MTTRGALDRPVICLTFDTDHVDERGMAQFLSICPLPGNGTIFCTQFYRALAGTRHEVGPHPFLGDDGGWESELDSRRQQFPDAVSWRSHSCVFSHWLAAWLQRSGYRFVSVFDELGVTGLRPNRLSWGIWHLPIYYMDSLDLGRQQFQTEGSGAPFDERLIEQAISIPGLYVFDFHPFHLLLNTPSVEFYMTAREKFRAGANLLSLRHTGRGAASFFEALCDRMRDAGLASTKMCEALDPATA
jgi:hypothetical protein